MATNWDLYNKRLNINGSTKRERDLQSLQNTLNNKLPDLLSYKTVKINGADASIEIVKTTKDYIKVIHSLPNTSFDCGDYVLYSGNTYLITEIDADKDVYISGKMQLCNYTLKFQHSTTGTILSYPCIDESSNTVGIDESNTINTLSGVRKIELPFDDNTKLIDYDDRFFTSRSKPITSKVTNINDTEYSFGDKGLIVFTLESDSAYNPQTDRFDLGICNYFEPTVTPTPPDPEVPTEIVTITSDATNDEVILGITHTFSATFKNELGQDVSGVVAQYSVDENYGGKVVLVDNGNKTATITVGGFDDIELCTKQFTLTCRDTINNYSSSIVLTIVGLT